MLPAFLTLPAFWIYSLSAACPDLCIDPVYESALPMLLLLLLIELCLSDLLFVPIKLHMDLNVTDPSLQSALSRRDYIGNSMSHAVPFIQRSFESENAVVNPDNVKASVRLYAVLTVV